MRYFKSATDFTATCDDDELRKLYKYPEAAWLRMNFVASVDGAVTSDGVSGTLASKTDKHLFRLLRELPDVILVGAGTVRNENYGGAVLAAAAQQRRREAGQSAVPPIAVVTRSCSLSPTSRLFTETSVPPLIITSTDAPAEAKERVAAAGGDVIEAPPDEATGIRGHDVIEALHARGLTRILCEGGPHLFGAMLAADAVDDLCLSIAPVLTAGDAGRIATSALPQERRLQLAHTLSGDDGTVFTRWIRQ